MVKFDHKRHECVAHVKEGGGVPQIALTEGIELNSVFLPVVLMKEYQYFWGLSVFFQSWEELGSEGGLCLVSTNISNKFHVFPDIKNITKTCI